MPRLPCGINTLYYVAGYLAIRLDVRYILPMKNVQKEIMLLAGLCVSALCVSCDNNELLRNYVNDHVVPAIFGGVEIADAAEWGQADSPDMAIVTDVVSQLRSLSAERGRAVITPKPEREQRGEPLHTILKITLHNEQSTVYEPVFYGADAGLALEWRSAGPSVFFVKLGPAEVDAVAGRRMLDITLKLNAPPGRKPPDAMALPIECAYSSRWKGGLVLVFPGEASVARGVTQQFYVASPATGDISISKWGLEGGGPGTFIDENGLLTVASDEQAQTLRVTAEAGGFFSGTATVTVINRQIIVMPVSGGSDIVERGKSQQFTASDFGVTAGPWVWSITGSDGTSTIDEKSGVLHVGKNETAIMLSVTAASYENPQTRGTAVARIPTVTGVTVVPDGGELEPGEGGQFLALVEGFCIDDKKGIKWSIEGNDSSGTTIGEDGHFSVAWDKPVDETAVKLTVRATSVYDDTKSGTATVDVIKPRVSLIHVTANGVAGSVTTTQLTLIFDRSIELTAEDITITSSGTGATKGALDGDGFVYTLAVSGISAAGSITVSVVRDGYKITPSSQTVTVCYSAGQPASIKERLGLPEVTSVTTAFYALHDYIQADGLSTGTVQLGDWIDLGGLTVAAFNGSGDFTTSNTDLVGNHGTLLRLIVVGINSFNGKNDNDKPHVVFQFKNVPVTRGLGGDSSNYAVSEIRKYLTPVDDASGSGNFLVGLINAGVPEAVLWAPKRYVAQAATGSDAVMIEDLLWLPTVCEMANGPSYRNTSAETDTNQASLETYYNSNSRRIKYNSGNSATSYWTASLYPTGSGYTYIITDGALQYTTPTSHLGIAPAFCVK
jgi:hypothetical protein